MLREEFEVTSGRINDGVRPSGVIRFSRFLIYGNLILLALEYFVLPSYSKMHGGAPWQDFVRMSLCVLDVVAAYAIIRGFTVFGIAVIGGTSAVMFVLPLIVSPVIYGWPSVIVYLILFFWDFVTLVYLVNREKRGGQF
jgi:hypothetical protein